MAGFHARLAPSSSKMWIECPASVHDDGTGGSDEDSIYARAGTAAHEIGCKAVESGEDAADFIGSTANGMEVTEEMAEAVQVYVDLCRNEATFTAEGGIYKIHAEDQVSLDSLNPPEPVWGTTDCWILQEHAATLVVIDYKHGKGIVVDATENDQGRCYALGVLVKLMQQRPEAVRHLRFVEVVICQPRAAHPDGPIRRERISVEDLIAWYRHRLLPAIIRTQSPDPAFKAGDHCTFCRRRGRCKTRQEYALGQAELLYQDGGREVALIKTPPDPKELSPEQMARVLLAAPLLRDWLRGVEEYALRCHLQIPGHKRVETQGHRTWVDARSIEALLLALFSLKEDDIIQRKVRSPAQIEKLLTKAQRKALANFYHRPPGGVALVLESDKRPAIDVLDRAAALYRTKDDGDDQG